MWSTRLCVLLLLWTVITRCSLAKETFHEEVLLLPLSGERTLVHLHFSLETSGKSHHSLYPRPLYQISKLLLFEEFRLHFTQGRWLTFRYGAAPLPTKPVGVEMSTAFSRQLPLPQLGQQWGNLTQALSGLFCASLNFLAGAPAVGQRYVSMQAGGQPSISRSNWLYAALPREAVCTENLTPWVRLLPCRDQAGPAALLRELPAASAEYYSMAVMLKTGRGQGSTSSELPQQLTMSLTLVLKASQLAGTASWAAGRQTPESVAGLLGGACPVATSSRLFVAQGPGSHEGSARVLACELGNCPASVLGAADAVMARGKEGVVMPLRGPQPQTEVHRHVMGPEGFHGTLLMHISRPAGVCHTAMWSPAERHPPSSSPASPRLGQMSTMAGEPAQGDAGLAVVPLCIFQLIPWYISVWLHTLELRVDGQTANLDSQTLVRRLQPAQTRGRPLVLDLCLALPANFSIASVAVRFDKQFLTVFEQPPDKDHGFDIPAAIVTLGAANCTARWKWSFEDGSTANSTASSPLLQLLTQSDQPEEVYSEALLVPLPLPDASMPYNVICFTCTVLAFYVGATMNVLLKRPPEVDAASVAAARKAKTIKFVVVLVLVGALAVYIDPNLQDQLQPLASQAAQLLGMDLKQ